MELTLADKMNLTQLASSPYYESLKKLFDLEVTSARDEAMETDPADREKRSARMDTAYAMNEFRKRIQKQIEFAGLDYLGQVQAAAAREAMKDQEFIESVILGQ